MVSTIPLRNTVALGMDGITQASWPDIGSDAGGAFIPGLYDTGSRLSPKTNAILYQSNGTDQLVTFGAAHLDTSSYAAATWTGVLASPKFEFTAQPKNSGVMGFVNNSLIIGEFNYTNNPVVIARGLASVRFAWIDMPANSLTTALVVSSAEFAADQSGTLTNVSWDWIANAPKFSDSEIVLMTYSQSGADYNFYGFVFDGAGFTAEYNLFQVPAVAFVIEWADVKYSGGYDALAYQLGSNFLKVSFNPQPYTNGTGAFSSGFIEIDFQESDINDCILGLVTFWWPWLITGYKQEFYTFAIINQNTQQFSVILLDRNLAFYDRYNITGNDALASQIILNMLTTTEAYFTITYDENADLFQVCANDDDTTGSAYPIQYGIFQISSPSKRLRSLNRFNLGCVNYCINLLKQRKSIR